MSNRHYGAGSTGQGSHSWQKWTLKKKDNAYRFHRLGKDYKPTGESTHQISGDIVDVGLKWVPGLDLPPHPQFGRTPYGVLYLEIPQEYAPGDQPIMQVVEFPITDSTNIIVNALVWKKRNGMIDGSFMTLRCWEKEVEKKGGTKKVYANIYVEFEDQNDRGLAYEFNSPDVPQVIRLATRERNGQVEAKKFAGWPPAGEGWEVTKTESDHVDQWWAGHVEQLNAAFSANYAKTPGKAETTTAQGSNDDFPGADDEPPMGDDYIF